LVNNIGDLGVVRPPASDVVGLEPTLPSLPPRDQHPVVALVALFPLLTLIVLLMSLMFAMVKHDGKRQRC
jgi:hypothetical protein